MTRINFILVHIGNVLFPYVIDCINQIKKFNDCEIYLVASEVHNNDFKECGVNLLNIEKIHQSDNHTSFNAKSRLDKNFRGGFWHYATERFFFIEDVMREFDIQNVIHMENDNLIYCNVNDYKEIFEENYKIAAVFDNDTRCVPSFMYIKNVDYLSELTKFIMDKGGTVNDMEVISLFKKNIGIVDNLPVVPKDFGLPPLPYPMKTNSRDQYSKNIDLFNSIFDGAAIGQYVGGVDPRNVGGDTSGFVNWDSSYNVLGLNICWKKTDKGKTPFAEYNNKEYRVNNLHIHSKNLKKFM